jgi:uncharacterized protein YdeI (YjbR/CyaY-like superfamily)
MESKLTFKDKSEFREWLEANHDTHGAVWLVFGKGAKLETLHPDEALKEALCFGWIDGLIKRVDDSYYIKRFSHRNKSSVWSERNKGFVKELIKNGSMTEYGLEEIERAKKNGKWNSPKRKPITQDDIDELIIAIGNEEPALTNFMGMSPSIKKTYTGFYMDAKKEETRRRRLMKIVDRLNKNLKPM